MTDFVSGLTERAAAALPDHPAIVDGERRLTYRELYDRILRGVAWLRASGIGQGDRVGYLGMNSLDYVVLMQAAQRIGAVTVAINWRLVAREIAFILRDAGIDLLVTEGARLGTVEAAVAEAGIGRVVLTDGHHDGSPRFDDGILVCEPDEEVDDLADDTVALQLYTSGTTGHPKGALLTHGSLRASLTQGDRTGEDWAQWDESDVSLVAMPQFHIGGSAWTMQGLRGKSSMVLLQQPDIADLIAAVESHGITKMFAVPAVLNMILGHPDAQGKTFPSMRELLYGASPIPLDILKRSMAKFPEAQFVQMYGATETSGTVVYLPPEDHDPAGTERMKGCGKPFPDVEIRIADEDGNELPTGEVGEVLVRSPLVMAGYHNLPEATARAFHGDWYRSGDAAYVDEDGYLYLFDRVKDMIVSGAENIYPAEVENALSDHPAVADVAVIGVPDEKWGEAVKALVVLAKGEAAGEAELIAFARERIAGFKVPKSVDFVDGLPRNPSGKVLKRELRKAYWPEGERNIG